MSTENTATTTTAPAHDTELTEIKTVVENQATWDDADEALASALADALESLGYDRDDEAFSLDVRVIRNTK